jgi:hypothetical protein
LIRQRKRALEELSNAESRFQQLDKTASSDQRESWLKQMEDANKVRTADGKTAAMDVYNPTNEKSKLCLHLLMDEKDLTELKLSQRLLFNFDSCERRVEVTVLSVLLPGLQPPFRCKNSSQ